MYTLAYFVTLFNGYKHVGLLILLFCRESARIQFRLPDASTVVHTFPSSEPLSTARDFILNVISVVLYYFIM